MSRTASRRRGGALPILLMVFLSAPLPGIEPNLPATDRHADILTLTFVGDIMHHMPTAEMADYDRLYDAVRPHLIRDDLSFANIEFPVDPSRAPSGYPRFNGTRDYLRAAIRGGFDVFALANNHTFDWGHTTAIATDRVFRSLSAETPLSYNGIRSARNAPIDMTIIEHRGWTIGFVSVTAFSNVPNATSTINQVNYANPTVRADFLLQVSQWSNTVDLLIVGIHAGSEYVTTPDPEKAAFFQDVGGAGATIVWGHHPHVLQPWIVQEFGDHAALIMYSTGNFITAQRRYQSTETPAGRWAPTGDTALYQVIMDRRSGHPVIADVQTPVLTTHKDDDGAYVLNWFSDVLARPLPLSWRAFYLARYSLITAQVSHQ